MTRAEVIANLRGANDTIASLTTEARALFDVAVDGGADPDQLVAASRQIADALRMLSASFTASTVTLEEIEQQEKN